MVDIEDGTTQNNHEVAHLKKQVYSLYVRNEYSHQRVRVPEGAAEILEGEHPHQVLKQEEDGEGAGDDNVPSDATLLCLVRVLDGDHKQSQVDQLDYISKDHAKNRRVDL